MFCPNCGTENPGDSRFCSGCGSALPAAAQNAVEEAAPQINEAAAEGAAFVSETAQGAFDTAAAQANEAYGAAQGAYDTAAAQANEAYGAAQVAFDTAAAAAPVFTAEQPSAPAQSYAGNYAVSPSPAPKEKKSKKGLLIGIIAGVVALLAIAAVLYFLVLKPKTAEIDLTKYVSVEYEGFDGRADALVSFDWNQLIADIGEAKKLSTDGFKTSADFVDPPEKWKNTAAFINTISMFAVNDEGDTEYLDDVLGFSGFDGKGLSNGDTIDIKIRYSEDYAKKDNLKITNSAMQITVSGLESVPQVDPFDGLEVTFTGTSGNGWCDYEYKGTRDDIYGFDFECDKYSDLSNGDEIVIKYTGYDEENPDWSDFVPTVTEKTYVVEGLDFYITSIEDLDPQALEAIKTAVQKDALTNNEDIDDADVSDPEYCGYLLAYLDEPDYYDNNKLILVYRSEITPYETGAVPYALYYAAGYTDLLNTEDALEDAYTTRLYNSVDLPYTDSYVGGFVDPYSLVQFFYEDYYDSEWKTVVGGELQDYTEGDGIVHSVDDLSAEALAQLKDAATARMQQAVDDAYSSTGVPFDNYRIIGCFTGYRPEYTTRKYCNYMMFVVVADYTMGGQTGVVYLPYFFEGLIATNDGVVVTGEGKTFGAESDPGLTELSDVYDDPLTRWKTDLGYSEVEVRGQDLIDAIPADLLAAA